MTWPSSYCMHLVSTYSYLVILYNKQAYFISCALWGPRLTKCWALFHCDNLSLVTAVKKGCSKYLDVMNLIWSLWFFVTVFDINLTIEHITGVNNSAAEMLLRNNVSNLVSLCPQAPRWPTPLPQPLFQLLAIQGLDWMSPNFGMLFRSTMDMIWPHATPLAKKLSSLLLQNPEATDPNIWINHAIICITPGYLRPF